MTTPTHHRQEAHPVIYAGARPSTSTARWFRQLGVVCKLNCILLVRYWKSAVFQALLLPLIVIGIVFGVQKAYTADNGTTLAGNTNVATWKMDGIHQCEPLPLSGKCMTVVYAPQDAETTQIMSYFQSQNEARTKGALKIEDKVWNDLSSAPSSNLGIVPMPSEAFIYDYALAHPDTIQLGVVFDKKVEGTGPIHWSYQIYYNMTQATNMSTLPGFKYSKEAGFNRNSVADDAYGTLLPNMIRALDESMLTFMDPTHQPATLDYSLKSFPTTSSTKGYVSAGDMMTILSNLLALPACITMVMAMLRVTREKELKCKESMQMMGLGSGAYWMGQWLTAWIMALVQGTIMTALGYAFRMEFFVNTNAAVMWLMFVLLAYGMTMLGFLMTTFCGKTGTALGFGFAIVVGVLIGVPILSQAWRGLWVDSSMGPPRPTYSWVLSFVFPFIHFARLWGQISPLAQGSTSYQTGEYTAPTGFFWANLTNYEYPREEANLLPLPVSGLTYYGINIILAAVLIMYFDQVIPNEHGHSRSIFFFFGGIGRLFKRIRHGGAAGLDKKKSEDAQKIIPYEGQPPMNEDSDVMAEREKAVHCQSEVAIRISNLTKTYTKSGPGFFRNLYLALCCCCSPRHRRSNTIVNKAVDRLNLITEPNELFALLGQNGAGKSTTMQMLYGVTAPNSGNAFLFNRSIREDMGEIRSSMGVCPQHDVLFADLTCWEHMVLYAGIKDLPAEALWPSLSGSKDDPEEEGEDKKQDHFVKENRRSTWIRSRLEAVQLWKDRHTMAGNLSGGMKRRLSTIISTIGDPQVLILDEPTTGMDPVHRRHVWTFLAQFKRGRSILLTTHSMEEADALGDKVAIMVAGHLKAIGNTTRLKNKFGNGYRVEMALGQFIPEHDAHQNNNHSLPTQRQLEQEMTSITRSIIPECTLLDQSGGVMVFGIPLQAIERMAALTEMLESCQAQGKIKQWGIAQTSLEEVFLSLIRSSEDSH